MAGKHTEIELMIQTAWSKQNRGRLFRNDNGVAYTGKPTKKPAKFPTGARSLTITNPKYVTYGLFVGSSDLIGFEFVDGIPVFCSIEVKTKAHPGLTNDQKDWLNFVAASGGKAYVGRENNNGGYDLLKWENKIYE